MLVQLKSNNCPVCRASCQTIFIVDDPSLSYESLASTSWGETYQGFTKDMHSGLYFESKEELNRLAAIKKTSCQLCKVEFRNVTEYKNHAKEVHKKVLCEQCVQSSKLFPSEQSLFEENELVNHKKSMHKKCNVCGNFFYDTSGLVAHIKQNHHFCDFCPFEHRVAFLNFESLEKHYQEKHFYCELFECKRQKCFVFKKYEDFQEHYRKEHPGKIAPKPAMSFKVGVEEEKCVFEDNSQKRGQSGSVSSTEFPALGAPAKSNSRALDYSKVISAPNAWVKPAYVPPKVNISKPKEQPKEQPKRVERQPRGEVIERFESPSKPSLLEANISRINNHDMSLEEFVEFIRKEQIPIDNQLFVKLREKIVSNSDREDIIFRLNNPNYRKPHQNNPWEEKKGENLEGNGQNNRKIKIEDRFYDRFGEEKKTGFKAQPDQVRPAGNSRHLDELSDKNIETLLDNICLLNTELIDVKDFALSIKEFISPQQMTLALEIIQSNLKDKSNYEKICKLISQGPVRPVNNRSMNQGNNRFVEQPRVVNNKSSNNRFLESQSENRSENRNAFNSNNRFLESQSENRNAFNSNKRFESQEERLDDKFFPEFPPVNHEEISRVEEILTENLEMYKSKVISISELAKACADIISPQLKDVAFGIISKNVKDSKGIIDKLNEIMEGRRGDGRDGRDGRDFRDRGVYNRRAWRRPLRRN
jgi:hypothetical protein